jgi:protein O-GlcNAc transferase
MKLTLGKALRKGFIKRLRILGRSADDQVVPVQVMDRDDEVEPFDDIDKRLSLPGTDAQDLPSDQLQSIIQLFTQGHLQQALVNATKTLEEFPNSAVLYNIAGACYAGLMQFDAAIVSYTQALTIDASYAKAHNNIAIALNAKGDSQAALASCERALEIDPDYADAYNNMANILKGRGELDAAINSYTNALRITPDDAEIFNNIGIALSAQGDFGAAIKSYKQALILKPHYAEAYLNIGAVLQNIGDLGAAIDSYQQALYISPNYFEGHHNMGTALMTKEDVEGAIDSFEKALKIEPNYANAYYGKGSALVDKGAVDAGIESYEMALKINPDHSAARTHKLHQQSHICDWDAVEKDRHLIASLGLSTDSVEPYALQSLEDAPDRHRLRSESFVKKKYGYKLSSLPRAQPLKQPQRLRIGYFSADFHTHPVAYLLAKVLEIHDRKSFEVYGYSIGPSKNDDMRQRLIKAFDVFTDVKDMSDDEIALKAKRDKIDIAIDLTGYTQHCRPGIFFYRAAPIQINYLGFSSTMGADFIDYIIADPVLIPRDHEQYYSEQVLRLPNTFMPTDNTREISACQITRADVGLPDEAFVFCCFNNNFKISPREFDIWMRVLTQVEGSVLWLRNSNTWSERNLLAQVKKRGVDPSRLIFAGRVPMDEHLARQRLADLFLDTFAYNAHTTASEALWAGLPVITKAGKGFSARAAASLLTAIELPELITETEQDYEALILHLASHPERLTQVREKLTNNRLTTPLFNTALYTRHLEDGYQQAYQRYYDGKPAQAISVLDLS